MKTDFHMHTCFCDGKNTPEAMVLDAIASGFDAVGISGHSYQEIDECRMMPDGMRLYLAELARLKKKYADRIRVFCGIEQDYYSPAPDRILSSAPEGCFDISEGCFGAPAGNSSEDDNTAENAGGFDYMIGSVHYLLTEEGFISVDYTPEILSDAISRCCGGDPYALTEAYFRTEADVLRKTGADIVGHFDLVSKFNEKGNFFDETHPRYRKAWHEALEALLPFGKPFEINTGVVSRGWRTHPYPNDEMVRYIADRGGHLILSSDSHSAGTIGFQFDRWRAHVTELTGKKDLIIDFF